MDNNNKIPVCISSSQKHFWHGWKLVSQIIDKETKEIEIIQSRQCSTCRFIEIQKNIVK